MERSLFWQFENANAFEYINLLPQSKKRMDEVSKLAQKLFISSFSLELSRVKGEDQKESTEQEFGRYKEEVDKFYIKIKKEREELKRDDEIGRLLGNVEKQMRAWEGKYDRVDLSSKMAFQYTKQILSCLIPGKQFFQLKQKRDKIQKDVAQCKGALLKIANQTNQYLEKYSKLKQSILPNADFVKKEVFREITENFEEVFGQQILSKLKVNADGKKLLQQINQKQVELLKFLKSITEKKCIDDPDDQMLFEFMQKSGQNKKEFQYDVKRVEMQKGQSKGFKLLKINKSTFRNLIADMITANNEVIDAKPAKPAATCESKFLIQPIRNSVNYLIADITNPALNKTKYTAPFQFYGGMGFIHLSQSLVVAGGYKKGSVHNTVHQLFENHEVKSLPPMKLKRWGFPLVEFNNGKTIIAICGYNGSDDMSECQKLSQFKNWSDLPRTSQKFDGASACSVGASRVLVFGGYPINRAVSAQSLDLNRVDKNWEKIDVPSNPFKVRCYDSAVYLEEKIIVFGSRGGGFTVQMNVLDDIGIEMKSLKLPFEYDQYYLIVWKRYKGSVYSMSNKIDKVWRYYEREWK